MDTKLDFFKYLFTQSVFNFHTSMRLNVLQFNPKLYCTVYFVPNRPRCLFRLYSFTSKVNRQHNARIACKIEHEPSFYNGPVATKYSKLIFQSVQSLYFLYFLEDLPTSLMNELTMVLDVNLIVRSNTLSHSPQFSAKHFPHQVIANSLPMLRITMCWSNFCYRNGKCIYKIRREKMKSNKHDWSTTRYTFCLHDAPFFQHLHKL